VLLTPLGESYLLHAQEILRSVDTMSDLSRAARGASFGQFRLGVIPTIAPYLLPKIIAPLSAEFTDVDINIRESMTPNLLDDLADGRIDAAILALPVMVATLHEVTLFEENFLLVRPKIDRHKKVPDKNMLREMKLLLLEEGHCFRDQALSFCDITPNTPRKSLEGTSLSTLVQMVGADIGVTLIPQMAAEVETRAAPVCVAHFDAPEPSRTVGMVWRKTSPLAHHYQKIADIIRRQVVDQKQEE
jgi:LysR family hydrogen peroxide-inducible transcriptional activator